MIVPSGGENFSQAMRWVAETFHALKSIIAARGLSTAVGDEGGFAPKLESNDAALDLLLEAFDKAKRRAGIDMHIALDVAASELFDEATGHYRLDHERVSREDLLRWYEKIASRYPIISIEDPFHEDDVVGFADITKILGKQMQIVGDDLFVTNERLIRQGIEHHYANAVLIKMNQIGTITETLQATSLTQQAGMRAIISHRSGETEDCTIADLAVGSNAGQIKTGSLSRSERVAKYNRLLRIEEELGEKAVFLPWCRRG
jgi:enolase